MHLQLLFTNFVDILTLNDTMWTELSDPAIMKQLGARIKDYRIGMGMRQSDVAKESGVSLNTINKIESGKPVSFVLMISVMRTLNLLENLELLVPESRISPLQLLKLQGKKVKRVRLQNN